MKRFWLLAALSAMFISCSQELTPKGDLTVSSVGLPATESVQVTITGPNGFSDQITLNGSDSVTLNGVLVGAYTVESEDVSGFREVAAVTTTIANTGSEQVTLTFAALAGSLNVTVGGKVGATPAVVTVRGPLPATTERTLSFAANGSQSLSSLQPGNYEIVAGAVAGHTAPAAQTVEIKDQQTSSVSLNYLALGNLNVVVKGTPGQNPAVGSFTVTGPDGFSQTRTNADTTFSFTDLKPGDYSISVVAPSGFASSVDTTSPFSIAGGQTRIVTVDYSQ